MQTIAIRPALMRWFVAACLAVSITPALAQRAGTLVVNGDDWLSATVIERRAFLVGAANMIIAEEAYAKRRSLAPAPVGAQVTKGVGKLSMPEIEARITRFYEGSPGRRSTPVMGVLWQEFVRARP